ncbi:cytochrome c biogenesis CcdA family protein [Oscillospiraceae bacterium LTW-04]|nr:cytochrome c biogenesis protein CcdA [Oscillospiraceae bacterium MB24-C1]
MQYLLLFLEGIITFISPCLLPLLPVYISYFAGQNGEGNTRKTLKGALGFIAGFTTVFVSLGAFAGTLGGLLSRHTVMVNLITGAIVVIFGLNYLGVFKIGFLNRVMQHKTATVSHSFFSTFLFGMVFSVGWTPCVGAFLGSALMLASQQGSAVGGILMLLCYSLGLGVPFLLAALLLNQLQGSFNWIKTHYNIINTVSGLLLVVVGILMMTGQMGRFLALLSL